MLMLGN
jgi:hypothetical protein